jgi:hypothetical protein
MLVLILIDNWDSSCLFDSTLAYDEATSYQDTDDSAELFDFIFSAIIPVIYSYTAPNATMPVMKKRKGLYRGPISSTDYDITCGETGYDTTTLALHLSANQTLLNNAISIITSSVLDFSRGLS